MPHTDKRLLCDGAKNNNKVNQTRSVLDIFNRPNDILKSFSRAQKHSKVQAYGSLEVRA